MNSVRTLFSARMRSAFLVAVVRVRWVRMFRTCWWASPVQRRPPDVSGGRGGGVLGGCRCLALGGQLGFVGGVGVVHGAGPVGEVGLVEQPGQVGDGIVRGGKEAVAAAGVVVQQTVQVAHRPAVGGWEGQQCCPGGGGLVPRPGWGIGVLAPSGGQQHPPRVRYRPPPPAPTLVCRSWARSASIFVSCVRSNHPLFERRGGKRTTTWWGAIWCVTCTVVPQVVHRVGVGVVQGVDGGPPAGGVAAFPGGQALGEGAVAAGLDFGGQPRPGAGRYGPG